MTHSDIQTRKLIQNRTKEGQVEVEFAHKKRAHRNVAVANTSQYL